MHKLSHGLIAFVFCFLFVSPPAYACMPGFEYSIFFDVIPEQLREADVIAKVTLLTEIHALPMDASAILATINVAQVIKAADARVRQGEKIPIKHASMGCDYMHHKNGDEGTIIAKAGADAEGRLVLCPYSRLLGYDRVDLKPPDVYECLPAEVEATRPTRLAAEQGDAGAQYELGRTYDWGREVRNNDAEAIKWYLLAAVQRNSNAQNALEAMELQNRGVTANYAEVEKLLQLAAEKRIFPAKEALEALQKQREAH